MNIETALLWLATLLPIVISPGPANILYAASGSAFGIRATLPFWLATNIVSIFQALAIGFGLDYLLSSYPQLTLMLKYMGIIFLLYLAFKFFKMSNTVKENIAPLTFKDGVILELFNIKYLLVPTIMFSQFYHSETDGYTQIFILTFCLVSLTLATSMVWIIGGKSLAYFTSKKENQRIQGALFGSLLCLTALWLFIS